VRTSCPLDPLGRSFYRRCLEKNPSQCVDTQVWSYPSSTKNDYWSTCDDNSDKVMNSNMSPEQPCNGSN